MPQQVTGRLQQAAQIPRETSTSLRPDIVVWSRSTKHSTLGGEDRGGTSPSSLRVSRMYGEPGIYQLKSAAGISLWRALGLLGIEGVARKKQVADVSKQGEVTSRWILLKRNERWQSQASSREAGMVHHPKAIQST